MTWWVRGELGVRIRHGDIRQKGPGATGARSHWNLRNTVNTIPRAPFSYRTSGTVRTETVDVDAGRVVPRRVPNLRRWQWIPRGWVFARL